MSTPTPRAPLLLGDDAARARAVAREIADALRPVARDRRVQRELGPGLDRGCAGLAVALGCADTDDDTDDADAGNDDDRRAARALLAAAVAAIGDAPLGIDLYGGVTGIAWAAEILRARGVVDTGADANDAVDEALLAVLSRGPWRGHLDLVSGLAGIGVYALERLPAPRAADCIRHIVAHLEARAVADDDGVHWPTPPALLPAWQRNAAPTGLIDLGMAHGAAGIIAFLAGATAAAVCRDDAATLAERGVAWLLAQALPPDASPGARIPAHLVVGAPPVPSRSAWCYGDPGVAAALAVAGCALDRGDWLDAARDLAVAAAARSARAAAVVDAPLCHGAAGLAHIYHRLYRTLGEPALATAARRWLHTALAMRDPERGVAGFPLGGRSDGERPAWRAVHGLIDGAAGVMLALRAAADERPIRTAWSIWDRCLGLSVRGGVHGRSEAR